MSEYGGKHLAIEPWLTALGVVEYIPLFTQYRGVEVRNKAFSPVYLILHFCVFNLIKYKIYIHESYISYTLISANATFTV